MIDKNKLKKYNIGELLKKYPFLSLFFENNDLDINNKHHLSLEDFFLTLEKDIIDNKILDSQYEKILTLINNMLDFFDDSDNKIKNITIIAGKNKYGEKEQFDKLEIKKGEIICIVGPTGSGKSRLLADIEWVAQKDTPTLRTILINNQKPNDKWRYSTSDKLVAQLSQNMNFVMDLSVYEFLKLHAESRMISDQEMIIDKIIEKGNDLAGEKFNKNSPITSLSGGQSRALMIADTAILSKSPIILIDEIENAGINRKEALNLLLSENKIVLMATHDPILALMGDKRIIIKNGGIHKVIKTTPKEREILTTLETLDKTLMQYRSDLRSGKILKKIES